MGADVGLISVVICTAGRVTKLRALLDSLAASQVPADMNAEIVLINNEPGLDLSPLAHELCGLLPFNLRPSVEPKRGLGRARNRGLECAHGRILAFTDDDCLVAPTWLTEIQRCFARDPALEGLGGRVEPADPADRPITLRLGDSPAELSATEQVFGFLHGCNMAFRRELFDRVGGFDPDFGAGSRLGAGEDAELVYRANRAGAKIRYEPSVAVRHDHGRRSWRQMRSTLNRYHQANGAILAKHSRTGDEEARALLRKIWRGPLDSLSKQPYSASETLRASYHFAMFGVGALRYRMIAAGRPPARE